MEEFDITTDAGEAPAEYGEFRLDSEDKVNWALGKLGNWEAEQARVKAQSTLILARIAKEQAAFLDRFQAELEEYTRKQIEGGKRKSVDLLQGRMAFRKVPSNISVTDRDAAIAYAKANLPHAVVETLDAKEYREAAKLALQQDGELLPGMEVSPERESFSIQFKSES